MNISKIAVNRPTTFLIIFILIIGIGIYASLDLSIDLYPDINPPVLFVFTNYQGTGPEEIEKTITRPLESSLSNVSNIKEITSTSSEGASQILLEFTWGTDMSEASNEVRDKLEYIKEYLPDDAESPMIFKFDPSMFPIMYLGIKGNREPEDLRKIGEDIIQPRLEQVEGVAMAGISGGRERVIRVEIPQNRLEAYNLTLTQISAMLIGQNVQISAGSIEEGNKNFLIRTSGEYERIEDIKNTVIAYRGGSYNEQGKTNNIVVRLRDVANVYDGLKDAEDLIFVNGLPSVFITVQKQSGTNSVRTAKNVYKRMKRLKNEIPHNVSIEVIYDTTKIIKQSLSQVAFTAIFGAFLAIIILFLFLRSFKSVLIIGLSIPISIVITMLLMYFFGFTLNVMTLAGLALGIGMLVDNSIVILENIYRYREKGAKVTASAILGSQEMINAIMASTLTTICVFAPIAMFKTQLGMYGELFSGLAFTVVFSLASSLFVAMFLVPVLSSKYFPLSSQLERNLTGFPKRFDDYMNNLLNKLDDLYKKALSYVLKKRLYTILIIAAVLLITLFMSGIAGFQLMPDSDDDNVQLKLELPVGTKLEITKSITDQFEQIIKEEIKGYKNILIQAGERSFFGFLGSVQSHKGTIFITLEDKMSKRVETSSEIKSKLRKHFNDFPSVIFEFDSNQGMMQSASPIDILVKSNDLDKARETAYEIKELIKDKVKEITEPNVDFKEGLPQVEIFINRDKAYSLGLTIDAIGREIRANIDGITASKYKEGADEYDIFVILDPKDRDAIPDLDKIFVLNNSGDKIPLASIAHREKTLGPINIKRENQTRTIHVTGGLEKKIEVNGKNKRVKLNEVELKVRKLINSEISQGDDLIIDFSGDYADLIEYGLKLIIILLLSIALVFGIMASQFESFLDPLIIFFTIPLTLIGVIWIYLVTFEQFSILSMVGLIVLSGIVVNNGIVLVDYTNLLIKRGYKIIDACIEAGRNRLRPILMTTLTTILGLLPMAFIKTEGSTLSRAIAKTVVGGLTVSTIFTLFLIPVIYSLFNQMSQKRKIKQQQKRQEQLEIRKQKLSGIRK